MNLVWQTRAARARALALARPDVAETLRFYAWLAELQAALSPSDTIVKFSDDIARVAPASLREAIQSIDRSAAEWQPIIERYWNSGGEDWDEADEIAWFLIEAYRQPFARQPCPFCTTAPVVALLREQGHGARRFLVCAVCLGERPSQRLTCVACGESKAETLVAFTADEFDQARIDACDSCQAYIKTIDLTRDGNADPIVDDLASLALDLWIREQGYHRLRPNLLRL